MGAGQPGVVEEGASQVGVEEICSCHQGVGQVSAGEVASGQVLAPQVERHEVEAAVFTEEKFVDLALQGDGDLGEGLGGVGVLLGGHCVLQRTS